MAVTVDADIRRMTQQEFGRVAYKVMECVFAIHNEMGRFFSEEIYRDVAALRLPDAQAEVRIEVRFEDFVKEYFIDLLVGGGAIFELKTAAALTASHRSQLLNYLLLTGLSHGKLVNLRQELVEHEFVNTNLTRSDCTRFEVDDRNWREVGDSARPLAPWLVRLLRDIGAGLDLHCYEDAVTHFVGGEGAVVQEVDVLDGARRVGKQKLRLAAPGWTFKITAVDSAEQAPFEEHARRFLNHTPLHGLQWINVTRKQVTFKTIEK
jgi:GxxExxY protein